MKTRLIAPLKGQPVAHRNRHRREYAARPQKSLSAPLAGLVLLMVFCAASLHAEDTEPAPAPGGPGDIFTLRGQFRDLFVYYPVETYSLTGREKKLVSDLKRLRLSPELNFSERLIIHMDYDNEIISGSYLESPEFDELWRPSGYNDLLRMSWEPSYDDDLYYRTRIHRLYAKIAAGDFTVTVGRQLVRFGSGRLWNPLDVMNPISPTALEGAEEQKGIDALRVEYYLNATTELGLIVDQKRYRNRDSLDELSTENTNAVGRLKISLGGIELSGLGGRISHRATGGADISAIVLDGMLRGSLLYSDPEEGASFVQAGAGYEYNFAMGLYFLMEYFYNQNGLNFNGDLKNLYLENRAGAMNEEIFRGLSNQFLTYNRHYAALALGYDITALLRGDFFILYDFQGRGVFLNPSLTYNAFQNIDVSLAVMRAHVFSDAPEESDFAAFEKDVLVFASLVWYF